MKSMLAVIIAVALVVACGNQARALDVDAYIKKDRFGTIKLSPTGEYYAATIPFEDKTSLVIIRRADNKVTANFRLGKNTHVVNFWWVNPERVLISMAEKFGALDRPGLTGELYAINADGGSADILVGQRVAGNGLGTKIQPKKVEMVAAFLIDDLPHDDRNVLISVSPFSADPYTQVDRMDVYTGHRTRVARAPVRNADFVTDNAGVVRFARGSNSDNDHKLYYRKGEDAEWELVNVESASGHDEWPVGFSDDDRTAYLEVEQANGPNAIVAMDVATGTRKQVLRDAIGDPGLILYRNATATPVGAQFMTGTTKTLFIDEASPEARLYHALEAAFPGQSVLITSRTADGKLALVQTSSDRNPGDFYVFDTVAKKADYLLSRRDWFDPEQMAQMMPVAVTARDGMTLHGYLTIPHGSDGKHLPLVVNPHGGPFGIEDVWGFDTETQLLAAAGYAVLQVNFRGSGGYGRAFEHAGARQWGGKMQDDVTDATHWAIQQGIADPARICIYGASYGAYAALMGAAREPTLYKCVVGYVGVYDLPTMHTDGDIQERGSGETYLREWIGTREELAAISPNRMADRIKAPVFLAAGGKDERAPIAHSKMMEKALGSAGVAVETLYFPTEGHGFYVDANRKVYYTKLLAFLGRYLGNGSVASAAQ